MADLDPRFTFENFVVGPANRLASAAARRAAESPGASYNPLFVYSASGLGKTHILGAIARHANKVHSEKSIVYQTLESFLGELAESLAGGDRDELRGRYEKIEILLMDDVQFLAGQTEAQEMLLRLLDTLTGSGRQVVLASDRPPAEIDGLDARLRSRFEGGLLVDIGPPEYETRVAIIRKRAEARGQALDPGVAEVIGRVAFRNVRELTGALNRVLAIQELEERAVTSEEAASMLGEERAEPAGEDLGQFLEEISGTVAEQVERQETPWRKLLRETAEWAEGEGFKADRFRRLMEQDATPADLDLMVQDFRETVRRLGEIGAELDAVGNPWPEAAHGVLRDPERLEEAEALLASAKERARPFPVIPSGAPLQVLSGRLPSLVIRAAEQLILTDRPEYNPLYVWSEDESAAQALLEAAGRSYLAENEGARVAHVSVSGFAEDFIGALSNGVAGAWRERWWSAELLLVHGAQDLSKTERAQDEFFHLFEALQRRRARIMVTADRPPSRIGKIDDRLRSRFEGGLVLEVERLAVESPAPAGAGGQEDPGEPGAVIPPLDQIVLEDEGRGGLFFAREPDEARTRPAGPAAPQGQGSGRPPPGQGQDGSERRKKGKDVAELDREWLMAFSAGPAVPLGRAVTVEGEAEEEAREEEALVAGAWFPSPERVVWEWPRMDERLVEDPD